MMSFSSGQLGFYNPKPTRSVSAIVSLTHEYAPYYCCIYQQGYQAITNRVTLATA